MFHCGQTGFSGWDRMIIFQTRLGVGKGFIQF